MNASTALRVLLTALVTAVFALPAAQASGDRYPGQAQQADGDKPPEFVGGEWSDHFLTPQWIFKTVDTVANRGRLLLKLDEPLHWTQTWTSHFAGGEFFQTEAISDSVRLAPNGTGQYFTTGVYTSTVHDAGKPVDWSASEWTFSGTPDSSQVEYRTGNTPMPDNAWTSWASPGKALLEYLCVYITDTDRGECTTNMSGIDSSRYIQYRAAFDSPDPSSTVALYDIDLLYGTHPVTGTASSVWVSPADLLQWERVIISSTVPVSTALAIDILAADGTVLLQNAGDGDSLAGIDPHTHPAITLRATFTTMDTSLTPDVDMWGVRWSVVTKLYLPVMTHVSS